MESQDHAASGSVVRAMKSGAIISAFAMISAALVPDSKLRAQESLPSDLSPANQVTFMCPFFDIRSVPDLRREIREVYEGTISSDPRPFPLTDLMRLASHELPKLYILTGNWYDLHSLRQEYRVVLGRSPQFDVTLRFHAALFERDSGAMREVAALASPSGAEPFLAPVAELPELAALYAELFEGGDGLDAAFDRLDRTAAARAASLAAEADDRQTEERSGDRERLSLAWLDFHLARIASRRPGRSASAAGHLARAADLVSPRCQPRTRLYFRTLASRQSPCDGNDLDERVDVYLCWLPEAILDDGSGRASRRKPAG
ncbi:hypothetical protein [Sphingosinicella sp. CPCC 101087]|uniref:hypothetical protein n=1 Tax=Sphingosinicella sp. CPCC 101087 TaxID=2497754 RepID=UPI00101BA2B8|nr:hypothetical protein [Sphingosinicella sp. CPCC 101087]